SPAGARGCRGVVVARFPAARGPLRGLSFFPRARRGRGAGLINTSGGGGWGPAAPLAAAPQPDSEQIRSSPRTSRLLWRMIVSRQQSAEAVAVTPRRNR